MRFMHVRLEGTCEWFIALYSNNKSGYLEYGFCDRASCNKPTWHWYPDFPLKSYGDWDWNIIEEFDSKEDMQLAMISIQFIEAL